MEIISMYCRIINKTWKKHHLIFHILTRLIVPMENKFFSFHISLNH